MKLLQAVVARKILVGAPRKFFQYQLLEGRQGG